MQTTIRHTLEAVDLQNVDVLEEGIAPSVIGTMCVRDGGGPTEPPPPCDPNSTGCDTLPG